MGFCSGLSISLFLVKTSLNFFWGFSLGLFAKFYFFGSLVITNTKSRYLDFLSSFIGGSLSRVLILCYIPFSGTL